MTAKLYVINPRQDRHTRTAKRMIAETCDVIDNVERRVVGYAIVALDDRGYTAGAFQSGGVIAPSLIATHVSRVIGAGIQLVEQGEKS